MNKIVWVLWLQGYDNAPPVVRKCIASWITKNPDWQINVLDRGTIGDYVDISVPKSTLELLSDQHYSDLLRFALLTRYGGVWVDATLYCRKPLDSWIFDQMGSGFFAFSHEAEDRVLAVWFLAANAGNVIASKLYEMQRDYWLTYPRVTYKKPKIRIYRKIQKKLPRVTLNKTNLISKLISKNLGKAYLFPPYFLTNYLFDDLLRFNDEVRALWARTPVLMAADPLLISALGYNSNIDDKGKYLIGCSSSPLFKLTWKADTVGENCESVISYICCNTD